MHQPLLITGIGTAIGKTLIAAMVTEALQADYWKPVQAGWEDGTDSDFVSKLITNPYTQIKEEAYKLKMPASPHIAAEKESVLIDLNVLMEKADLYLKQAFPRQLVIEGAGGLLVPLNIRETIADLALTLNAKLILVSRNYLGSINHSLLTAAYCKSRGLDVLGWIFNDEYLQYEKEIVVWSGYPSLGSIPHLDNINAEAIRKPTLGLQKALFESLNLNP